MQGRLSRRVIGALCARLPDAALQRVPDPRKSGRCSWSLGVILTSAVTAILCGLKSLAQMEALTAEISPAVRKKLRLKRRLPDTTTRDTLVRTDPEELRRAIYRQVRQAHRRRALTAVGLPFGVATLDGKVTAVRALAGGYVQPRHDERGASFGLVRTVTATLISSAAKVCLDASPMPSADNEQSHYPTALEALVAAYGSLGLFKLVTYDAGGCSRVNARYTRELDLHYLMRVKTKSQQKLAAHIKSTLDSRGLAEADGVLEEQLNGEHVRRSVYLSEEVAAWPSWTGLRTIVRLCVERLAPDRSVLESEERYYVTSLAQDALSAVQWISVMRGHWAVENNCHQTWDAVLGEDERPWITSSSKGTVVVMLLRRIAYNILALYRCVTLRAESSRLVAWRTLCRWFYNALIGATVEQLADLRVRKPWEELLV